MEDHKDTDTFCEANPGRDPSVKVWLSRDIAIKRLKKNVVALVALTLRIHNNLVFIRFPVAADGLEYTLEMVRDKLSEILLEFKEGEPK